MYKLLIFLLILLISFPVYAEIYSYQINKVIDGDTVEIEAPFLPYPLKPKLLLRIEGVDTPELGYKAQCNQENIKSIAAKKFIEQEIMKAVDIKIKINDWDKYGGRILGDVILDKIPLSVILIKRGYAFPYTGKGKKPKWCDLK